MSKFVPTSLGVFRHWKSENGERGFLFLCPDCNEWLPLDEANMGAAKLVDHERILNGVGQGVFCSFRGLRQFGSILVSTLQARHLMGEDFDHPYETSLTEAVGQANALMERNGARPYALEALKK